MKCFGWWLIGKPTPFQNSTCEGCWASTGVYQAGRISISNSFKPEDWLSEWLCFPTMLDTSQLPVRWDRRPWCGITWQEVWHQCLGHFLNTKHVGVKQLLHLLSVRRGGKKSPQAQSITGLPSLWRGLKFVKTTQFYRHPQTNQSSPVFSVKAIWFSNPILNYQTKLAAIFQRPNQKWLFQLF